MSIWVLQNVIPVFLPYLLNLPCFSILHVKELSETHGCGLHIFYNLWSSIFLRASLGVMYMLSSLLLPSTLGGQYYYYPQFKGEEAEPQRG